MRKIILLIFLFITTSNIYGQGGWVLRESGTRKTLRSISSSDGWAVVAVGDSGTVVNSGTAGVSWDVQKSIKWIFRLSALNPNVDLYGITAISDSIFCATGATDSIFRSIDRGKTWRGIRSNAKGS